MTNVLLQELNNSDIDWMLATDTKKEVPADTVLFYQEQFVKSLYILLDGALTISVNQTNNKKLDSAATLAENEMLGLEIARLSSGEMVGEFPFLKTNVLTIYCKKFEKVPDVVCTFMGVDKKVATRCKFFCH